MSHSENFHSLKNCTRGKASLQTVKESCSEQGKGRGRAAQLGVIWEGEPDQQRSSAKIQPSPGVCRTGAAC